MGALLSGSLHPVASPAVDREGNIYTTFSGSRGQKTAVAVYKIDTEGVLSPFVTELMNATGLAFNRSGVLHVSSRFDGVVYQVSSGGEVSVYVEGMGVATGMAFDEDQSGTPDLRFRDTRGVDLGVSPVLRAGGYAVRHRTDDVEL